MTQSESMVERVAMALYADFLENWENVERKAWDELSGRQHYLARKQARSAIAAMRKPTEAMATVVAPFFDNAITYGQPDQAQWCWHAMIDAALSEPPEAQ